MRRKVLMSSDDGPCYCIGEPISHGIYSSVYRCYSAKNRFEEFAAKIYNRTAMDAIPDAKQVLVNEITALYSIQSRYICNKVDIFDSDRNIYIVVEYAHNGNLLKAIKKHQTAGAGGLSDRLARRWLQQLLWGLLDVHSAGFAHLDIKPENLLLDKSNDLKICDFGFCVRFDRSSGQRLFQDCGTPVYVAPEVLEQQGDSGNNNNNAGYDGFQADVWSVGVTLYVMLTGSLPFYGRTNEELYQRIKSGRIPENQRITDSAMHFLKCCLEVDPCKRWTIEMLSHHPFCRGLEASALLDGTANLTPLSTGSAALFPPHLQHFAQASGLPATPRDVHAISSGEQTSASSPHLSHTTSATSIAKNVLVSEQQQQQQQQQQSQFCQTSIFRADAHFSMASHSWTSLREFGARVLNEKELRSWKILSRRRRRRRARKIKKQEERDGRRREQASAGAAAAASDQTVGDYSPTSTATPSSTQIPPTTPQEVVGESNPNNNNCNYEISASVAAPRHRNGNKKNSACEPLLSPSDNLVPKALQRTKSTAASTPVSSEEDSYYDDEDDEEDDGNETGLTSRNSSFTSNNKDSRFAAAASSSSPPLLETLRIDEGEEFDEEGNAIAAPAVIKSRTNSNETVSVDRMRGLKRFTSKEGLDHLAHEAGDDSDEPHVHLHLHCASAPAASTHNTPTRTFHHQDQKRTNSVIEGESSNRGFFDVFATSSTSQPMSPLGNLSTSLNRNLAGGANNNNNNTLSKKRATRSTSFTSTSKNPSTPHKGQQQQQQHQQQQTVGGGSLQQHHLGGSRQDFLGSSPSSPFGGAASLPSSSSSKAKQRRRGSKVASGTSAAAAPAMHSTKTKLKTPFPLASSTGISLSRQVTAPTIHNKSSSQESRLDQALLLHHHRHHPSRASTSFPDQPPTPANSIKSATSSSSSNARQSNSRERPSSANDGGRLSFNSSTTQALSSINASATCSTTSNNNNNNNNSGNNNRSNSFTPPLGGGGGSGSSLSTPQNALVSERKSPLRRHGAKNVNGSVGGAAAATSDSHLHHLHHHHPHHSHHQSRHKNNNTPTAAAIQRELNRALNVHTHRPSIYLRLEWVHFQVFVRWCFVVVQFLVLGLLRILFNIKLEKYISLEGPLARLLQVEEEVEQPQFEEPVTAASNTSDENGKGNKTK